MAAVGVGWTAACVASPDLLGSEKQLTTRLLTALFGGLLFGAIGAADDLTRLRRNQPLGLRRGSRLILEIGAAAAVLGILKANDCLTTGLSLPVFGYVELGAAAPLLYGAELVALAGSARVADGADGTVCGASFVAMLALTALLTLLGWFPLAVLPAALAGALLAFLVWNFPPAKITMGSTGCMFAAGVLGCVPLCIGWPGLSVPLALPFWLDGGMVAVQIVFYSIAHRPLFCTAPLHRWLEKKNISQVGIFYFFCAAALCGAVLTLKLLSAA